MNELRCPCSSVQYIRPQNSNNTCWALGTSHLEGTRNIYRSRDGHHVPASSSVAMYINMDSEAINEGGRTERRNTIADEVNATLKIGSWEDEVARRSRYQIN